jgi:hypothetical protein
MEKESINIGLEKNISLPITDRFYILKNKLQSNPNLVVEMENAFSSIIDRLNPSDRGTRFITGGSYEWVLATVCWECGVNLSPNGHNSNRIDLSEYINDFKQAWSLKTFTSKKLTGDLRLVNRMSSENSAEIVWSTPTIFISPQFPGMVYINPDIAPEYAKRTKLDAEKLTINASLIIKFAEDNPSCVFKFNAPINKNLGKSSMQLDIVSNILSSGTYPILGKRIKSLVENDIKYNSILQLHGEGSIDASKRDELISKIK